MSIKRKHLDLDEETIRVLEHEAVDVGSNFKNYVEGLLAALAQYSHYNKSLKGKEFADSQIQLLKKAVKPH